MEGKSFAINNRSQQYQAVSDTKDLDIIGSNKPCKTCREVCLSSCIYLGYKGYDTLVHLFLLFYLTLYLTSHMII